LPDELTIRLASWCGEAPLLALVPIDQGMGAGLVNEPGASHGQVEDLLDGVI